MMEFIWSETQENNFAEKDMWNALKNALKLEEGICYHRYPVFSADRSRREPDILILHRHWGLYVIEVKGCKIDNIEQIDGPVWRMQNWHSKTESPYTQAEDQMWAVMNKFKIESELRKGRTDLISSHAFVALPYISSQEWKEKGLDNSPASPLTIIFSDDLESDKLTKKLLSFPATEKQVPLTENQWKLAKGVLQGTPVLKKEIRPEPTNLNSKAEFLRKVEEQILSMDRDQMDLAQTVPPGPQRIRGLAGSGKTIVLCMKAAWMHSRHPNWDIVFTFYTRSLYSTIKNFITRFYRYWIDQDPDWNKIHILHGWGSKDQPGLYRNIASKMRITPRSFKEARNLFTYHDSNELLGKCCKELLQSNSEIPVEYDAIIIDEAQDFHYDFFKLCYAILKDPKRLIWAYDEIQSLESLAIPTTKDIFGLNSDGSSIIDLDGTYDNGEIERDLILEKCYRTPRPIMIAAHIFGMGLLRKSGPIQFIPTKGGWEDIGYKIVEGIFDEGKEIIIERPKENSPHILEDLVGYQNLLITKKFTSKDKELTWIADQIYDNIFKDELRPEEILVIGFPINWNKMNEELLNLSKILEAKRINVFTPDSNTDKNIFQIKDHVTLTHIYKAKGNEASIVYVISFEDIEAKPNIIVQSRNQAFTAMTRSKGWCIITGIEDGVSELFTELQTILKNPGKVTFKVPFKDTIKRNLDSLEYEKRRKRLSKAKKAVSDLIEYVSEDEDLRKDLEIFKQKLEKKEMKEKKSGYT